MNKEERFKQIGARIKDKRTALKMSQDTLAIKAGYKGKSIISRIEKGEIDLPESKLNAIADALETTAYELVTGEKVTQNLFREFSSDDSDIIKAQNFLIVLKGFGLSDSDAEFLFELATTPKTLAKIKKLYELMED